MRNNCGLDLLPKLDAAFANSNWDELSKLLCPKDFATSDSGDLIAYQVLAKVAQILTTDESVIPVPESIRIVCLKCLGNFCLNGYKYTENLSTKPESDRYFNKLYANISKTNETEAETSYSYESHFPYEGVAEWTCKYIISHNPETESLPNQLEILRLSIQFLCNLFTFACKDHLYPDGYITPKCLSNIELQNCIISCTESDYLPLARASCIFIHNALKELPEYYFTLEEQIRLCSILMKPLRAGFDSAKDSLMYLLHCANVLRNAYPDMSMDDKLYFLELIYNEIAETIHQTDAADVFCKDTIEFLCERFRRRSDLILKTVDTYLDGMEPTEVVILLDIIGSLTSSTSEKYDFVKSDKSLLINCTYLLKSIQMIGNESDNVFTPLQKLSDVAPSAQGITIDEKLKEMANGVQVSRDETRKSDLHSHPAFGFKAGLIRVIGNMSYHNRMCQDMLREMDAIPLLLDCCNIDARNPLIMQWTILALRNLCECNQENQEIIRNCTRVGIVESSVLTEMGLTLHEDDGGKKVGIMPLVKRGSQ